MAAQLKHSFPRSEATGMQRSFWFELKKSISTFDLKL